MNRTSVFAITAAALLATTQLAWADKGRGRSDDDRDRERYEYRERQENFGQETSRRAHERNAARKAEKRKDNDDDRRYSRDDRRDRDVIYDRDGRPIGVRQTNSNVVYDRDGREIGTRGANGVIYDKSGRPISTGNQPYDPNRAITEAVIGAIVK